jgi:hypothetical protein
VRSISSDLHTAESALSVTPFARLTFKSPAGATVLSVSTTQPNRITMIEHTEELYSSSAGVVLNNSDLTVPDLTGCYVEPEYGAKIAGGTYECSATSRLWVKTQDSISAQGQLYAVPHLEGVWSVLDEQILRLGAAPYYSTTYTTTTVYNIISAILSIQGMSLSALGTQDDSIINTFLPNFVVNADNMFDVSSADIRILIAMTKCILRAKAGKIFEVRYPQNSDTVDETYYSNAVPYFNENDFKTILTVPNHVYVYGNATVDTYGNVIDWNSILGAEATNSTQISKYMDVSRVFPAPLITIQGDLNNRAAAILSRLDLEREQGRVIVQHDSRVEIGDKASIHDVRANTTYSIRVSGLTHRFQSGTFQLEMRAGGLNSVYSTIAGSIASAPVITAEEPIVVAPTTAIPAKTQVIDISPITLKIEPGPVYIPTKLPVVTPPTPSQIAAMTLIIEPIEHYKPPTKVTPKPTTPAKLGGHIVEE